MSVNIEELDPKFEVELLKKFDLGTVKIGDRIPYLEQHLTVVTNLKHATPPYRELTVTKKLIQTLKLKYHMFIVNAVETVECGRIPERDDINIERYEEMKKSMEQCAVVEIWKKGEIVLKFEWRTNKMFGLTLYAVTGVVQTR